MICYAQRSGVDFYCSKCKLAWDHDDPEPPECPEKTSETITDPKQQEMNFDP